MSYRIVGISSDRELSAFDHLHAYDLAKSINPIEAFVPTVTGRHIFIDRANLV